MSHMHPFPDQAEEIQFFDEARVERKERVVTSTGVGRRWLAVLIGRFIWVVFGIASGLIVIRIILRLIDADPAAPIANFIYRITDVFLWPFYGLVAEPSIGGRVFELSSVIAVIVYVFLSWVLARFVWLLLYRKPARVARTYEIERDFYNDMH